MSVKPVCPRCDSHNYVKAGVINQRQRYKCKDCAYHFTVQKIGKRIDPYYVIKSLQLYLEGLSYREIERILGVSHVTVSNWVKQHGIRKPQFSQGYHPTYKILSHSELSGFFASPDNLNGKGLLVTEVGDKFMVIRWDRFR